MNTLTSLSSGFNDVSTLHPTCTEQASAQQVKPFASGDVKNMKTSQSTHLLTLSPPRQHM